MIQHETLHKSIAASQDAGGYLLDIVQYDFDEEK
jgi:hypothetical protein